MFRFPSDLKLPATVAVLDCGTNSLLLTVARLEDGKRIRPLFEAFETPRLGEGLTGRGNIKPKAAARALRALRKLNRKSLGYKPDYSVIVGTDIFRRAGNGKPIARFFEHRLGIPLFILTPAEEAQFEFLGAVESLKNRLKVVVVDVGGGSSEIIWGQNGEIKRKISLKIGAVRLKEKLGVQSRYSPGSRQKMERAVLRKTRSLKPSTGYERAILTGGSATALAAFHLGQKSYDARKIHGQELTRHRLGELANRLAAMTLSKRRFALPFDPARADLVVPGAIILTAILRKLKIEKAVISHRGLRWGILYSYFA